MTATIERFASASDPDAVHVALERDGAAIVEGLLSSDVVDRVNEEVEATLEAVDPSDPLFDPIMQAFHGPFTKQVAGVAAISPTFAVDISSPSGSTEPLFTSGSGVAEDTVAVS